MVNHRRLHSAIGYVPPVELEEAFYRELARGADGAEEGPISPPSGATRPAKIAPRRSDGLVSEPIVGIGGIRG